MASPATLSRADLIEEVARLRNALLSLAAECAECGGTGLVTIHMPGNEGVPAVDADDQPCPGCAGIREYLRGKM